MPQQFVTPVQLIRFKPETGPEDAPDLLVTEEPMEIRLSAGGGLDRQQRSISVTMRTPGHDFELALGFLYSEGIIQSKDQVEQIRYCTEVKDEAEEGNVVLVALRPEVEVDWKRLERNFYTSSSCGVCGKSSIAAAEATGCPVIPAGTIRVSSDLLGSLSDKSRQIQVNFRHTGGIHAASLFDEEGNLVLQREDVGRHNAVDKVIGAAMAAGNMPLDGHILWVSGRAGFELVQKAAMAGIPIMASVGAPSSLSVQLARDRGMTLVGFLRDNRFNVYSGAERILMPTSPD